MIYHVFMNTRGANKSLPALAREARSLSDRSHGTQGQGSRCGSAAEEEEDPEEAMERKRRKLGKEAWAKIKANAAARAARDSRATLAS